MSGGLDGSIDRAYRFNGESVDGFRAHPDTGVDMTGPVPGWGAVCGEILDMHRYLSDLDYLGWDVVVTDDGFRVLEVNSLSAIAPVQFFRPVMRDERLREWFSLRGIV